MKTRFSLLLLRGGEELESPDQQVMRGKEVVFRQDDEADKAHVSLDVEREGEEVVLRRRPQQHGVVVADIWGGNCSHKTEDIKFTLIRTKLLFLHEGQRGHHVRPLGRRVDHIQVRNHLLHDERVTLLSAVPRRCGEIN